MNNPHVYRPVNADLIIFHGGCPDGWCAAYLAKRVYPNAELLPANYGMVVPYNQVQGKHVLMVDFAFKRDEILEIHHLAKSFTIYDHHVTAQKELEGLEFAVFDMNRSGATLTCDMLHGTQVPEDRPWYVNYVEDRDLWRWNLPGSRAVNAYLMALPQTQEAWDDLNRTDAQFAVQLGAAILLHIDHYIDKVTSNYVAANFHGFKTALVNAPFVNISDVCDKLLTFSGIEIGAGWFARNDGLIQFSLRSRGELDVAALAKLHGGGGHRNAAGFQLPTAEARSLIDYISMGAGQREVTQGS